MRRLKSSLFAFILTVAALAQTASEKPSTDVRRVGAHLRCQCGCPDSVATCIMLECGFGKPAKLKIAQMQAEIANIPREKLVQVLRLFSEADLRADPLSPLPLELALAESTLVRLQQDDGHGTLLRVTEQD